MTERDTRDASDASARLAAVERRAEAAERTVAVLKKKVVALYNGDTSAIHEKLQAARTRDAENRKRREILEVRAEELAKHSASLEVLVARRTAAIEAILNHVTFGFLRIDRFAVVEPSSTRSCKMLFATDTVEGRELPDLLAAGPREREQLLLAIEQVFEDLLPEEVSLAQLEQRFPTRDGRVLRAEGSVIRGEAGAIDAMLITISDITALEAATRESLENRTLVTILKQKPSFEAFLAEARQGLEIARDAHDDDARRRRVVHTIKGNAGSYGLGAVVAACHDAEERESLGDDALGAIEGALRAFLVANAEVLEIDYDDTRADAFEVSSAQMSALRTIVSGLDDAPPSLRAWTKGVLARPAGHYLGPLRAFTERLAERLGKEATLAIVGEDTLVDGATMRPILLAVPHLVRNALDHGIEAPALRAEKGVGRLVLTIADTGAGYEVRFADDGSGIDVERVRAKAEERGIAVPTGEDAMGLVFVDGVSTAEVTTTISGRGVGMGAVKGAAEAAGGTVVVESTRGRGTTVIVTVPKAPLDPPAPAPRPDART